MSDLVALVAGFAVGAGALTALLAARRSTPQVVAAPARQAPPPTRTPVPPRAPAPARPAASPARPSPPHATVAGPVVARLSIEGRGGTSVTLGDAPVRLGRGSDQDLRVTDSKASRAHAVVRPRRKGGWQLEDAGSANGTRVNDHRIPDGRVVPLRDGDRIGIGSTTIRYAEQPDPRSPAPDATQVLR